MEELLASISEINPLKDILVPLVAALLGLWVAARKFRSEQLWKDKYLAYQKVLQSLETISHWASETVSNTHMLPAVGTATITDEYVVAQREVLRQTTIGSLLLSNEFVSQLEMFKQEFFRERFNAEEGHYDDPQDWDIAWGRHAYKVQSIVDNHLEKLVDLARSDLGA